MKIKVCGLTKIENINQVTDLAVDFVGFIFYNKSARHVDLNPDLIKVIHGLTTKKVGVFVDEELNEVIRLKTLLGLDYIQLHGNESVEFCMDLQVFTKIIKVFKIDDDFDFSICKQFQFADYFLFETKGKLKGGNGTKFNWDVLSGYNLDIPFFLSGGVRLRDVEEILKLDYPLLKVVDINSGFELKPGFKNIKLIKEFRDELSNR